MRRFVWCFRSRSAGHWGWREKVCLGQNPRSSSKTLLQLNSSCVGKALEGWCPKQMKYWCYDDFDGIWWSGDIGLIGLLNQIRVSILVLTVLKYFWIMCPLTVLSINSNLNQKHIFMNFWRYSEAFLKW